MVARISASGAWGAAFAFAVLVCGCGSPARTFVSGTGGTDGGGAGGGGGSGATAGTGGTAGVGGGGTGGVAGAGGTDAGPPPAPGRPGTATLTGGALLKSPNYTLLVSVGEGPGTNGVLSSSSYTLHSGVVGTTQH